MKTSIQNRINIIQKTAQVINQVKGHVMFSWTWNSKGIYWCVPLALGTLVTIVHGTCQQELTEIEWMRANEATGTEFQATGRHNIFGFSSFERWKGEIKVKSNWIKLKGINMMKWRRKKNK